MGLTASSTGNSQPSARRPGPGLAAGPRGGGRVAAPGSHGAAARRRGGPGAPEALPPAAGARLAPSPPWDLSNDAEAARAVGEVDQQVHLGAQVEGLGG